MTDEGVRVLIVEDDASMGDLLSAILKDYAIHRAASLADARQILSEAQADVILLDLRLPDGSGMELLREIKDSGERTEVIVVTSVRDIPAVVKAMKLGAYDYINKDFEYDDVRTLVSRAVQKIAQERELDYLRSEISQYTQVDFFVGKSPKMKQVEEVVARMAAVPASVLITGESGTGKELIARRIHALSPNARKPFIAVNLSTLSEDSIESTLFGREEGRFPGGQVTEQGKFELANGGTLFLDEIGDLKLGVQARLLRAIQEKVIERVGGQKPIKVDVRIISATHRNLDEMMKNGEFREDLYYRLNVIPLHLPPLRERLEDVPELVATFVKKFSKQLGRSVRGASPEAIAILKKYSWPGNVRELENLVERLVSICDRETIGEGDIPIEYQVYQFDELKKLGEEDLIKAATAAFERSFILNVLEKENWNQTKTSERLGIHRKTLEYKVKKLNLGPIIDARR